MNVYRPGDTWQYDWDIAASGYLRQDWNCDGRHFLSGTPVWAALNIEESVKANKPVFNIYSYDQHGCESYVENLVYTMKELMDCASFVEWEFWDTHVVELWFAGYYG